MRICLLTFVYTSWVSFALSQVVPDTTNITIGDKTIILIDNNPTKQPAVTAPGENTPDPMETDLELKYIFTHFAGIDVGVCSLLNEQNSTRLDTSAEWLSLNLNRSLSWRINLFEQKFRFYRDYIGLLTGLGLVYNSFGLRNNVDLNYADSIGTFATTIAPEIRDYTKNKLRITSIQIPLMLEFNTGSNANKHAHLALGVQAGWTINSIHKQKWENESGDFTSRRKDNFNINPLSFDLAARVGFNKFSVFMNYSLQPLFEKNLGSNVFPLVVGLQLIQF